MYITDWTVRMLDSTTDKLQFDGLARTVLEIENMNWFVKTIKLEPAVIILTRNQQGHIVDCSATQWSR